MGLFSILKSPNFNSIIERLNSVRIELDDAQRNLWKVISGQPNSEIYENINEYIIGAVARNSGAILWAKDKQGKFIFVHKIGREKILRYSNHATETTEQGIKIPLAIARLANERRHTIKGSRTTRFLECGMFNGSFIVIDTIKSPIWANNKLIGTMGSGVDITYLIDSCNKALSVEIPLDLALTEIEIAKILKEGSDDKSRQI